MYKLSNKRVKYNVDKVIYGEETCNFLCINCYTCASILYREVKMLKQT